MDEDLKQCAITEEDLRQGLRELKGYVDITEEDLLKIYSSALRHARKKIKLAMTVADLMTQHVVVVKTDTPLDEAAKRLAGLRISGMPVVDDQHKVIGVIGELDIISVLRGTKKRGIKDLLRRLMGEPAPKRKTGDHVGDIMSTPAITITSLADVREAARILDAHRIKRLPVVDEDNRLIGIISRADIVRAMGRTMEEKSGKAPRGKQALGRSA